MEGVKGEEYFRADGKTLGPCFQAQMTSAQTGKFEPAQLQIQAGACEFPQP